MDARNAGAHHLVRIVGILVGGRVSNCVPSALAAIDVVRLGSIVCQARTSADTSVSGRACGVSGADSIRYDTQDGRDLTGVRTEVPYHSQHTSVVN